jgi:hypothetical protein
MANATYVVWDELNGDESEGMHIEAYSSEEAATTYAKRDRDGLMDGLYTNGGRELSTLRDGHPIVVRDATGAQERFLVGVVELCPVYGAMRDPG